MASASRGLLLKLASNDNLPELAHVFHEMGLHPIARLAYKISLNTVSSIQAEKLDVRALNHPRLEKFLEKTGLPLNNRRLDRLLSVSKNQLHLITDILEDLMVDAGSYGKTGFFNLDFSEDAISSSRPSEVSLAEALALALDVGAVRLTDLYLEKHELGPFSLKKASSGEQCLLVLLLGIAGHIEDGSLVLIDEPEISLHPKWQEDFMLMLMHAYSRFKRCQFVIATHSPQLVSRLKGENCFVSSLSKRKLHSAADFSEKSADYQLAELFDAPGIMNEYISRVAFNLIASLRASKINDEIVCEYNHFIEIAKNLEKNDPMLDLVSTVKEAFKFYASRK